MKHNRKNESMTSAWDTTPTSAWPVDEPVAAAEPVSTYATEATPVGYEKYRAIYEFSARNADEISFQPGDIVMVRRNVHSIQILCLALGFKCLRLFIRLSKNKLMVSFSLIKQKPQD